MFNGDITFPLSCAARTQHHRDCVATASSTIYDSHALPEAENNLDVNDKLDTSSDLVIHILNVNSHKKSPLKIP